MTDENELEGQSRRTFLKTTGAVGVAATTGVAAFGGSASAQADVIRDIQVGGGESLIEVNVILNQVLENVNVNVDVDTGDINVLNIDVIGNVIVLDVDILSEDVSELIVTVTGVTQTGQNVTDSATTQV